MKKRNLYRLAAIIVLTGIVYACNKSNSNNNSTPGQSNADLQVQSDDQSRVSNETDAVTADVNVTLASPDAKGTTGAGYKSGKETSGAVPIRSLICDATVTIDSTASPRIVTITYNGANCAGTRTRTGVVVISIPAGKHWSDTGAQITVSIQNLKITRISDSKSITLNGTHVYTNVTGGRLIDLPIRGTIIHNVTADSMSIIFDDGSVRKWSVARQHKFTYNNGVVITTTGLHSDGTNTGITEWGTTRHGNSFMTMVTQPIVIRQDCSFRLTAGALEILRPDFAINIVFGLDATGNPTTCPGAGSTYYFKASWQGSGGKSGSFIWPY